MKIKFVEIQNFRKLKSVRIELSDDKTIFVGANNSGKTTAIVALRRFLIDQKHFDINDFTVTNWKKINTIGKTWEEDAASTHDMTEWEDRGEVFRVPFCFCHRGSNEKSHARERGLGGTDRDDSD